MKQKVGTIIVPPGVLIEKHEKLTVDFLANIGYDVTFIVPNRQQGSSTPDIEMLGMCWEIKSPKGKSSRTIENCVRQASKQSPNIIIDLRRTDRRIPESRLFTEAEKQFEKTKGIKRLIIITREENMVDFRR